MLSAQCTDKQVNKVTPALFERYPTVRDMAAASVEDVYPMVKSCGFKTKAANIVSACRLIMQNHGGEVPGTMEALTALPGVGRKTANVVLANAFGVPTIAVDTHVFRVSNRLGLADAKTVEENRAPAAEGHSQKGLGGRAPLADLPWAARMPCAGPRVRHLRAPAAVQGGEGRGGAVTTPAARAPGGKGRRGAGVGNAQGL